MYEGGWFLLPCEFPTFEVDNVTVVWSRYDLSPSIVHQHQLDGDELKDQNQLYRGRTSMSTDALKTGDLSLNLTGLRVSDSGTYTCYVRSAGGQRKVADVQLQVKEQFPSWATALLILLPIIFIIAVTLSVHFRHFFMSVYQVKVESGEESVLLSCKTLVCLLTDITDIRVEWKDNLNRMAYVYRNGSNQPKEQHRHYKGRSEMKRNLLRTGDVSLSLKHPTDEDTGTFTCTVYKEEKHLMEKKVILKVKVQPVEVDSGEKFVLLPCKTTVDLTKDVKVEWKDSKTRKVYVYHPGSDQPEEQHSLYRGRTEMNRLERGDITLSLKDPTSEDSGTFICTIYNREKNIMMKKQVQLKVKVQSVQVDSGEKSVLLPCKTTVDLTEDVKVEWKDSKSRKVYVYHLGSDQPEEQHSLYRGRTEMNLLECGDISLSLKDLTYEDSGTFICTVYNREKNIMMKKQVQLKVKENLTESFESFTELNPEKAYNMNRRRRGLALIFNQEQFHHQLGFCDRHGSEVDAPILEKSLMHLGFEVKLFTDLKKDDINAKLDKAANADHSDADCLLLVFMSYGEEGYVYAHDDKLAVNDIPDKFKGTNCSSLVGKPKIFIWQSDSGTECDRPCIDTNPEDNDAEVGSVNTLPAAADFIMCHAAAKGYVSFRNTVDGSWYIQDLCELLQKYGESLEFTELLTLVNAKVSKREARGNYRVNHLRQVPRFSSVPKKLYFLPK
ncbi:uncharacterized protein LOC114857094 isoform X2 [Betta splendens]|nr:uncharacterized protein LOC114857094 isoform X2 [Betta splendens]